MKRIILTFSIMLLAACAANRPIPGEAPTKVLPPATVEKESVPIPVVSNPNGGVSPAFSPDGGRIAFLSSTLHTPQDLWLMNSDGTGARRVTTKGANAFRWAADGKSIMISARRKGYDEVLSVDPESGSEQRFPGLPPNASIPVFSPDGKLFAFTVPGESRNRDLWIGTADGARIEAVTAKIGVRSFFWNPDSRRIYYESGRSYGGGVWEIDLATMKSRAILNQSIGTPEYSARAGLVAYPSPVKPGEFEVRTMKTDGSDVRIFKAPRLPGRNLEWDPAGTGVYYLGQELAAAPRDGDTRKAPAEEGKPASPHEPREKDTVRSGVTALWRLDLATGEERRISPEGLHLVNFTISPDGKRMALTALLEKSHGTELFDFDPATGEIRKLAESRFSYWMPVPALDSRIAAFTNEEMFDTLKVIDLAGEVLASYPGFELGKDTRLSWLPASDGLLLFSGGGLFAFSAKGAVEFPTSGDHRTYLYADVSLQADKVIMSSVPRYGENAGLYMLEAVDGKFVQTDLRYPSRPDAAAEVYLQPRWSLDGTKIAFNDGIDIWTMKGDGTGRAWITDYAENNREGKGKLSLASLPVWSVRGDRLCYTLTVFEGQTVLHQIWMVKEDGTEPRMLFSEEVDSQFQVLQPEYTNPPFFDATDDRIIFTAAAKGVPDIYAVDVRDGKIHRLTESGAIFPALIPEEGIIVYISLEGNNERLWAMNSDGTGKRPIIVKEAALPADIKAASPAAITAPAGAAKEIGGGPQGSGAPPADPGVSDAGAAKPAEKVKGKTPVKKKAAKKKAAKKKGPASDAGKP